jgi:Galactosyltransferase
LDSYKNMTLKQISVLKYLTERCSRIRYQYLFKTDDDIVMDLRSITRYINAIPKSGLNPRSTIFCFHMNEVPYVPRYADKWFVSNSEYPDDLYPAYCSGAGYLISKDLVAVLYDASLHVNTFWVDDTYISGILPQAVGAVTIIQIPKQSIVSYKSLVKNGDISKKMIIHVQQNSELFQIYWNKFQPSKGFTT